MFFNNNFADAASGYPVSDNKSLGLNGNLFEVTNDGPSDCSGIGLGAGIGGLSAAEIEDWWLAPKPDGNAGQYLGSTLLGAFRNELASPHDSQTGLTPGTSGVITNEVYGFDALGDESTDAPERAGPFTVGPSTGLYLDQPAQLPSSPPVTFTDLLASPSPASTLSWDYSPHPQTYASAGNGCSGTYDQSLAALSPCSQWSHPSPVGKGKAQAVDHSPLVQPSTPRNTAWRYKHPCTPEDCDPNPRMDVGTLDSDIFTQVAPSTGLQRSARGAKGKGKEIDRREGRRKRAPKKDLAPGINWSNTCGRFCAKMAKIYSEPTGEVTNPETAYASMKEFVKDDLYLSPLVVKPLGERPTRDLEQYLTGILNEVCPRTGGRKKGVWCMLERVAQELENGLVAVSDDFALLEGPPNEVNPRELDASGMAAKRRAVEQGRREAIRGSLERMTLFFRRPEPGYLWSRPQVLFYAIAYLVFGAGLFGDGGGFFTPKPQL